MEKRRVVITGIGILTSLGKTKEENFKNFLEGKNGISYIERFNASSFPVRIAAEIKNFDPSERLDKKEIKRNDRYTIYALWATDEAINDSKLSEKNIYDPYRIGVIISSGIGGIETLENEKEIALKKGYDRVSPFLVPMMIPDIAAGVISIKYGFKGPNYGIVSACASSAHSIGEAFKTIERGDADCMIVGGSEAPITPLGVAGFANMRALSTRNHEPDKASRPFDKERDGFVMGEGAAVLVLEELSFALKRGAKIYAEIAGYGASADAYHITAPCEDGEGAYMAMKKALEDAGITPYEIDYINSHGTATPRGDVAETIAIKKLLGERAYKVPVNATKSLIGHLLGAAGALEAAVTILSIKEGIIHPTRNLTNPDPECDLDYVKDGARKINIRYALSNSFGFGGHNASLLFKKFEE